MNVVFLALLTLLAGTEDAAPRVPRAEAEQAAVERVLESKPVLLAEHRGYLSWLEKHPPIAAAEEAGEVNVYSYRQPYLINPLFKAFTEETGIKVNVIFAEKGLIERIQAEGRNSPADVLLTVDVGNLTQAATWLLRRYVRDPGRSS